MHWKSFSEKQSAKIKLSFHQEGIPRKKLKNSSLTHACQSSNQFVAFQQKIIHSKLSSKEQKKWFFDLSSGRWPGDFLLFSCFVNLTPG